MIKVLDITTINQIAAGEVIERPVNIVKELIENAIDAHATRISIEIENGGIDRIVVKDNGDGFEKEDILLAFEPHATSKIVKIDDLNTIFTYGFRGEALASISLVSKVTLITKQRTDTNAYQIISDNGKLSDIVETSAQDGTKIIVDDLFGKIPARKKFLKSSSIEAAKIYDIVEKISLSRKDISFKFVSDGRERFSTAGNNKLSNIIYTLYGKDITDNLIDVDKEINNIHISGVIGKPQITKNNRNDEIFFVNGRYVKNEILHKAVEEAYKEYLMQHKYPFAVLNIELDGKLIDVNAHPQKTEIRFSNTLDIFSIVKNIVSQSLKQIVLINTQSIDQNVWTNQAVEKSQAVGTNQIVGAKQNVGERQNVGVSQHVGAVSDRPYNRSDNSYKESVSPQGEKQNVGKNQKVGAKQCEPASIDISDLKSLKELDDESIDEADDAYMSFDNNEFITSKKATQKSLYEYFNDEEQPVAAKFAYPQEEWAKFTSPQEVGAKFTNLQEVGAKQCEPSSRNHSYTYIGQLFNTYLIFELKDKVVFVDQHATHEKINYEKFIDLINNNSVKTQKIMPIVITLNAFQYNCVKENINDFRAIGYDIEFFGDKDIIVEGVPLNLIEVADKNFLIEMIDNFSKDNDLSHYDSIKDKIATMSCKASIKANQVVSDTEAYNLIQQLFTLKNPYNCPHGRPTMIEFTKVEFDKRFKRIVT